MAHTIQRGFTLVEMMVVVIIVGVLATLATYGVRKYVFAAKSHEYTWVIKDIKAGQEAFRTETHRYLNVSASLTSYYPNATPGKVKRNWGGPGNDEPNWRMLNLSFTEPVQFGYACVAGAPGETPPDPGTAATVTWPATGEPWYVVKGVGDVNGDGIKSTYVSSSFSGEVYIENDGE